MIEIAEIIQNTSGTFPLISKRMEKYATKPLILIEWSINIDYDMMFYSSN